MANTMFRKLKPQRPTVIRIGDKVKTCYYHKGMKSCLGSRCFWPRVGVCPIYNRIRVKMRKAK